MKPYSEYNNLAAKLDELLAKNLLVSTFRGQAYPITLTIGPDASPEAQMALFSTEDDASSADASVQFSFTTDGIGIRTTGRLVISDDLMSKIKSLAKKLVAAYLFGYFAEHIDGGQDKEQPDRASDAERKPEPDESNVEAFEGFFDDEGSDTDGAAEIEED